MSDKDTIYRQEAIDTLFELYEYQRNIDPTEAADLVRQGIYLAEKKIEQLPSAQPKRGKWIPYSQFYPEVNTHWVQWECSECGYARTKGWEGTTDGRCPTATICENCGADMRGSKDGID